MSYILKFCVIIEDYSITNSAVKTYLDNNGLNYKGKQIMD